MERTEEQKDRHLEVMVDFLRFLNLRTGSYILKGGTSLFLGYGLERFSEDLDFDSMDTRTFKALLSKYCALRGFGYSIKKDTDTVKRYMMKYADDVPALKMEISFRNQSIPESLITTKELIRMYKIEALAQMKANAYLQRDKIRDIYDVSFIVNKYWDTLPDLSRMALSNALAYKGLENFEYITEQQPDPLIDNEKLMDMFLRANEKAGLLNLSAPQGKNKEAPAQNHRRQKEKKENLLSR